MSSSATVLHEDILRDVTGVQRRAGTARNGSLLYLTVVMIALGPAVGLSAEAQRTDGQPPEAPSRTPAPARKGSSGAPDYASTESAGDTVPGKSSSNRHRERPVIGRIVGMERPQRETGTCLITINKGRRDGIVRGMRASWEVGPNSIAFLCVTAEAMQKAVTGLGRAVQRHQISHPPTTKRRRSHDLLQIGTERGHPAGYH